MCQWVIRNLRDLQKLVAVDSTRAVLVELHEPFLEAVELGCGDYAASAVEPLVQWGQTLASCRPRQAADRPEVEMNHRALVQGVGSWHEMDIQLDDFSSELKTVDSA